jgi:enterobacterial common antigen flippase
VACSLLTSVLTARILGPEGRGHLASVVLLATLCSGSAQLGLANSFVFHWGARHDLDYRRTIIWTTITVLFASITIAAVLLRITDGAQVESNNTLTIALSVSLTLLTFSSTAIQIDKSLNSYNIVRALPPLILLLALSVGIYFKFDFGYIEVLSIQAVTTAFAGFYCFSQLVARLKKPTSRTSVWSEITHIGSYAWKHHGTVLVGLLIINADKIFLLFSGSVESFGIYALAYSTTRVLSSVQDSASVAVFSRFAGSTDESLKNAVAASFRISFLPMLLCAILIALSTPWTIPFVFGASFSSMALPFSLLAIESVVGAASWTLAQRFTASGRPGLVLTRQIVSVIPLLSLLPFLSTDNLSTQLAGLMLATSIVRFAVTRMIYRWSLNERPPAAIVSLKTLAEDFHTLTQKGTRSKT